MIFLTPCSTPAISAVDMFVDPSLCCLARGTRGRPSPRAKMGPSPPRKDSKMQRKRTGPGAPRAGPSPRKREPVDA
jgi:hypothetical protein